MDILLLLYETLGLFGVSCVSCVQYLIVYFEAENSQNNEVSYVSFIYFHANFNNLREIIFCTTECDFELSTLNWISLYHSAELSYS